MAKKMRFYKAATKHHKLILTWLNKTHVKKFFHTQGLMNTLCDLNKYVNTKKSDCEHWIAFLDDNPFGYLITSHITDVDRRFTKWMKPKSSAITLDLLIGEENYLDKGLAGRMIREFLLDKFFHIKEVFIDPEVANLKALHVYEKEGFIKLEQFIAEWHPVPHWLMKLDRNHLIRD